MRLALLALGLIAGCAADPKQGYSFASVTPAGVRTVAVPVFANYAYEPGLDVELTEAVIKEIQRVTGWTIASGDAADTTLTAAITSVRYRRLSADPVTGLVNEMGVEVTVDFDWRDNRSGKTLASRRSFTSGDTFVPARPSREPIGAARTGTTQRLAKDIVAALRSEW